ncbi:MAG TPA: TonB family protein [Steroidobacteraceae bacterium]|nr:TonB family protein [Steroidobacteraceae bacterium]
MPVRFTLTTRPLVALTQDPQLLGTLRKVADPAHSVVPAGSEVDLSTALMTSEAGVALVDCAAIATPIATLTQRLTTQFPDLVLIVAGSVDEQGMLAPQITDGSVHRFLHKPFSEQRVRLFVESAWRRHEEARVAPQPVRARAYAPPRAARSPGWRVAIAAIAAAAVLLLWLNMRMPEAPPAATPPAPATAATAGSQAASAPAADHPGVAAPATPPDAQREHATSGNARRAAAGSPAALAVPGEAAATQPAAPGAQAGEAAQPPADGRVADYLSRARDALSRGQLLEPSEDSARYYVEAARELAPDAAEVRQAAADLSARLESEARQALAAQNAEQAQRWTAAAADVGADPAEIAALREETQQLSVARADSLAHVALTFNQRLAQGHLLEPPTDSAKFYLAQLLEQDAANPATQLARRAYGKRVLDEARSALKAQDFAATGKWLDEARAAGADAADIGGLQAALDVAQVQALAQPAGAVDASSLTRTRYVAPKFPDVARQRGIDGWVDLEFTIGTDGTVSDVAVVGAQPAGVFEKASLDAVRRWHYQPIVRDGQPVSQSARVRLRFVVEQR